MARARRPELSWREVAKVPVAREQYMYVRKTIHISIHYTRLHTKFDGMEWGWVSLEQFAGKIVKALAICRAKQDGN